MTPRAAAPELFCVELRTARWAELVEWYRTVLGLTVLVRVVDDGYALLAAGAAGSRCSPAPIPAPASERVSLGFEVADLDAVARPARGRGRRVHAAAPHAEGFRELVVHDPDGNTLRLFSWPLRRG